MRTALLLAALVPVVALVPLGGCRGRSSDPADADGGAAARAQAKMRAEEPLPRGEGRVDVEGGRIWYKLSGAGEGTPVILIHGGPGIASFYLKSLEALGDDRPVVRYDQLGSGNSGALTNVSMMTVGHFVEELDALRKQLGYDRVHLVGHSWGAMLAVEYSRAHPEHVASLTLASASLDMPAWGRHISRLVRTLSDPAQRAIQRHDAGSAGDAPGYAAAASEFYGKYVWRHPERADLDSMVATGNALIAVQMKGANQFTPGGTLKSYDATPYLGAVRVPALFLVGEFDEADPATVKRFAALTPSARYRMIPGAAHMITWDNPDATVSTVRAFLRDVDSTTAKRRRRLL